MEHNTYIRKQEKEQLKIKINLNILFFQLLKRAKECIFHSGLYFWYD